MLPVCDLLPRTSIPQKGPLNLTPKTHENPETQKHTSVKTQKHKRKHTNKNTKHINKNTKNPKNTRAQTHKHRRRHTHTHKDTNTKTQKDKHATQPKDKNIQSDVAIPTQTSKEHLQRVYCEMHLSIFGGGASFFRARRVWSSFGTCWTNGFWPYECLFVVDVGWLF